MVGGLGAARKKPLERALLSLRRLHRTVPSPGPHLSPSFTPCTGFSDSRMLRRCLATPPATWLTISSASCPASWAGSPTRKTIRLGPSAPNTQIR